MPGQTTSPYRSWSTTVVDCRAALVANGNELVLDCPDRLAVINTDHAKLHQATLNLLDNAAGFTRAF